MQVNAVGKINKTRIDMTVITIAASILSADFARLGEDTENALQAGADVVHFDVMDHHFVPNLSFGAVVCQDLRQYGITAPIDVHLMVTNPNDYIEAFAKAGANRMTFNPETVSDIQTTCDRIHAASMEAGLAFNPDKPVEISEAIFKSIDFILIMSVFAGFGGQTFIEHSLDKIRHTRKLIDAHNKKIILAVDGGIKVDNVASIVNAGADFLVIGSGLFDADNYQERIKQLREQR